MQKLKAREAEKCRKTAKQAAVIAVEEKQKLDTEEAMNRRIFASDAHKRRKLQRGQLL